MMRAFTYFVDLFDPKSFHRIFDTAFELQYLFWDFVSKKEKKKGKENPW